MWTELPDYHWEGIIHNPARREEIFLRSGKCGPGMFLRANKAGPFNLTVLQARL